MFSEFSANWRQILRHNQKNGLSWYSKSWRPSAHILWPIWVKTPDIHTTKELHPKKHTAIVREVFGSENTKTMSCDWKSINVSTIIVMLFRCQQHSPAMLISAGMAKWITRLWLILFAIFHSGLWLVVTLNYFNIHPTQTGCLKKVQHLHPKFWNDFTILHDLITLKTIMW